MTSFTEQELDELIRDRAIRLLVLAGGKRIWEASPSPLHQIIIDEIRTTIRPNSHNAGDVDVCGCYHLSDVYIRLPDQSLVRPDISIFCSRPPRQRKALTIVPPAVIEIISPNYETKDLEDLPPAYLANGVLDVVVVDADERQVIHFRSESTINHQMPVTINLQCGCLCTIDV
jgi:Uma2 family endonuclease